MNKQTDEALEQPEGKEFFERGKEIARWADKQAQEPVAIVYSMQDGYVGQMVVKGIPHKTKLYTHPAPQPAQESVEVYGILDDGGYVSIEATEEGAIKHCEFMNKHDCNCTYKPLYTHPHQWQGLTEDEALKMAIKDLEMVVAIFGNGDARWQDMHYDIDKTINACKEALEQECEDTEKMIKDGNIT
jgi:hypothetical protein